MRGPNTTPLDIDAFEEHISPANIPRWHHASRETQLAIHAGHVQYAENWPIHNLAQSINRKIAELPMPSRHAKRERTSSKYDNEVVGATVRMLFNDSEWYSGKVVEYDGINKHIVCFADGTQGWYNLQLEESLGSLIWQDRTNARRKRRKQPSRATHDHDLQLLDLSASMSEELDAEELDAEELDAEDLDDEWTDYISKAQAHEAPGRRDPPPLYQQRMRTCGLIPELLLYLSMHNALSCMGKRQWKYIRRWTETTEGRAHVRKAGLDDLSFHLHHVHAQASGGWNSVFNCVFAPGSCNGWWGKLPSKHMREYVGKAAVKLSEQHAQWCRAKAERMLSQQAFQAGVHG